MPTTAPPRPSVTNAGLEFLARHAPLWDQIGDDLTALSVGLYDVTVQTDTEGSALDVAVALGVSGPPVRLTHNPGFDGYTRSDIIDGLRISIVSCWQVKA